MFVCLGLAGFDNPMRDAKTEEVKRHIGQVSVHYTVYTCVEWVYTSLSKPVLQAGLTCFMFAKYLRSLLFYAVIKEQSFNFKVELGFRSDPFFQEQSFWKKDVIRPSFISLRS